MDVDLNERFYHDYLHERSGGWGGGGGAGLPDAQSYNAACCMLLCALSRWRRWPRCDY